MIGLTLFGVDSSQLEMDCELSTRKFRVRRDSDR